MATVMGGVGYGLYFVTKRYISPLIAPPTPPQLQQDKESIDEEFNRAFALLEQLQTDTAALKSSEEARTERLDAALREVEDVVSELKTASRRREDEGRRMNEEVRSLKDAIPKALEGAREGSEKRLQELGNELRSLKTLVGNRMGTAPSTPYSPSRPAYSNGTSTPQPEHSSSTNGLGSEAAVPPTSHLPSAASHSQSIPTRSVNPPPSSFPNSGSNSGRAAIPAWQMAAMKSKANSSAPSPTVSSADNAPDGGSAAGPGEVDGPAA